MRAAARGISPSTTGHTDCSGSELQRHRPVPSCKCKDVTDRSDSHLHVMHVSETGREATLALCGVWAQVVHQERAGGRDPGAEGRLRGSSALKDHHLFQVPALPRVTVCSHSALPTLPGARAGVGARLWSRGPRRGWDGLPTADIFRRGCTFSCGVWYAPSGTFPCGTVMSVCSEATSGHAWWWVSMSSFSMGPQAGRCQSKPGPVWTGDREKGK